MQLRLRTKLTLVMTGLVLLVVVVLSGVFVVQLLEQVLLDTDKRTREIANQVFEQARRALTDAKREGLRPASNDPEDIHDYVRHAFEIDEGLHAQLKAAKDTLSVYEVSITDRDGMVMVSTDEGLPRKFLLRRLPLSQLTQRSFLHQARVLAGPPRVYEYDFPFKNGPDPFGEVRVAVSSGLLLEEISPSVRKFGTIVALALVLSTALAAVVSGAALAPLRDISAQLDRISAGQFDAPSPEARGFAGGADELGQVSRKITQVGQQLRGVHEIFSTLRENMNSVMAGMEDGLLLFTREARAIMVSPAAEKFLGAPAGHFLGRRVNEIFPVGHPLHEVLHVEGDEFREIAAETDLATIEGPKRVSVSVQAIQEDGERMGALVTLRDLDSIESINTQLQVSERLAALSRITAGVAHEVKNPLNSMRLWLENLKKPLPAAPTGGAPKPVDVGRWRLKQAVLNRVPNAVEAMPNGGRLHLVLSRRGEMAEITVGDTGKGIPPENKQKIFQLFFTTRPGGSGIGLASTFRIVQLHNGSIEFTSEVGRGTTFRIELPLAA